MTERSATASPPGTRLVAALIALGLLATAWLRMGRVVAPREGEAPPLAALPWPDMRLDLNSASAAELTVVPGLGPALAQRIVADRQRRGPFGSVEELERVQGVAAALIEQVTPHLVAEPH